MDLIKQLKEEHVEIMQGFEGINEGVAKGSSGDKDLIQELESLQEKLITHLDLEDKMLYPALANSNEAEAKEVGEKFSEEMTGISKTVMAFFGKNMNTPIGDMVQSAEFRKELDGIIKAVIKRVEAEEKILFPAYAKCCA